MCYIRCLYKYTLHYISLVIKFVFVYICKKEIVSHIFCVKLNFSFLICISF